jgi:hypothetical protein
MLTGKPPISEAMPMPRTLCTRPRPLVALALALAGAAILGGCGTPAVIKPSATPLPGLKRDIQAALNVVSQTEREAQSDASSSVGGQ